jgi:hypothetical protein
MTPDIIKDLTSTKGQVVFQLLTEFNQEAAWGGYFYAGKDAETLAQVGNYEKTPRQGLHITSWHSNHGKLTPSEFLRLVTEQGTHDAKVLAYADDKCNQAIAVTRPPVYMTAATPHITISWIKGGNPAASGYMQFDDQMPEGIPTVMHGGSMKIITRDNRELNLDVFRAEIQLVERERMAEIASKLDPQITQIIDKNYNKMTCEELLAKCSAEVKFDEGLARLYTQYRLDITADEALSQDELTEETAYDDEEFDEL